MDSLLNKIKFSSVTKTNTVTLNCGVWGLRPDFPYPRNSPTCKLLML